MRRSSGTGEPTGPPDRVSRYRHRTAQENRHDPRIVLSTLGLVAAATLVLTGCGADAPTAGSESAVATASTAAASVTGSPTASSGGIVLGTASSPLGTILVDGAGKTLYVFDKNIES